MKPIRLSAAVTQLCPKPSAVCTAEKQPGDPIYLHDRWRHRKDEPNWRQHERQEYARRTADKNLRPPRTYREMERRVSNMKESQRRNFEVATPMTRLVEEKKTTFKFRQNKPEDRRQLSRHADEVHKYARERSQWESPVTVRKTDQPVMESIPSSERRERQAPTERKRPDMKGPERGESSHPERVRSGEAPDRGRESTMTSRSQVKPSNALRREEEQDKSDNVKVRTSPVVDKQKGGFFRKRPPSQPAEERGKRNNRR